MMPQSHWSDVVIEIVKRRLQEGQSGDRRLAENIEYKGEASCAQKIKLELLVGKDEWDSAVKAVEQKDQEPTATTDSISSETREGQLAKLQLSDGDILTFNTPGRLGSERTHWITKQLQRMVTHLGVRAEVVVLEDGATLNIVRPKHILPTMHIDLPKEETVVSDEEAKEKEEEKTFDQACKENAGRLYTAKQLICEKEHVHPMQISWIDFTRYGKNHYMKIGYELDGKRHTANRLTMKVSEFEAKVAEFEKRQEGPSLLGELARSHFEEEIICGSRYREKTKDDSEKEQRVRVLVAKSIIKEQFDEEYADSVTAICVKPSLLSDHVRIRYRFLELEQALDVLSHVFDDKYKEITGAVQKEVSEDLVAQSPSASEKPICHCTVTAAGLVKKPGCPEHG